MLGAPKIRMPNGKWYTPEILRGQGGFCHQCGGLLVDHENDGYEATLLPRKYEGEDSAGNDMFSGMPTYRIKPVSHKLPDGIFVCLGCGVKMKLTEIEKPVLVATPAP